MKDAIKITLMTLVLLFCVNADAEETTQEEIRTIIVDAIILDLQDLIEDPKTNKQAINLTNKIKVLIESYDSSIEAHRKVMFILKSQLEENGIKIRY